VRLRDHAFFCDRTVDRLTAQASQVQLTNPVAADRADRQITNLAGGSRRSPTATDLVSARLGDYQYVPTIDGLSDPKMQAAPEQRRHLTKPVTGVGHINLARGVSLRLDILTSRIPQRPAPGERGTQKGPPGSTGRIAGYCWRSAFFQREPDS
jgi:hypothetical protein